MRELTELENLLLIQAFDGRPLTVRYDAELPGLILAVTHENGKHQVQMNIEENELAMLTRDLEGFRHMLAEPIMHNLDSAAYPERWERLMPTFKRVAELLNGRSTR